MRGHFWGGALHRHERLAPARAVEECEALVRGCYFGFLHVHVPSCKDGLCLTTSLVSSPDNLRFNLRVHSFLLGIMRFLQPFVATALLLLPYTSAASPQRSDYEDEGLEEGNSVNEVTCGVKGYDRGVSAYSYSTKKKFASFQACGERCLKDEDCTTFAISSGECLLYTTVMYVTCRLFPCLESRYVMDGAI